MLKILKQNPSLLYMALITFGISLCTSVQLTNLSSIYRFLGASDGSLPALWLGPPLTGLIIQPLIGQISDETITRFGKRMPYIVLWSFLAAISSVCLPFLSTLTGAVLIMLIMNCSLNGGIEALRALTGDILKSETDRSQAFAMQAFFAGIGGALGAGLPYLINKLTLVTRRVNFANNIPVNLKFAFILSGLILFIITLYAMFIIRERHTKHSVLVKNKRQQRIQLYQRAKFIIRDFYYSCKKIPPLLRNICLIHSISWAGIFIFWLYFSVALAQNIYGLPLHNINTLDAKSREILQVATLDSSFYFSIYQYVSILYSGVLYFVSKSHKSNIYIHIVSLFIGGIAILLFPYEKTPLALEIAMIAYGIMWGSIMVLPYAIAIQYMPRRNLGIYLGIFNICITAPQIFCGLSLSLFYSYIFNENATLLLSLSGVLILVSVVLWLRFTQSDAKIYANTKLLSFNQVQE